MTQGTKVKIIAFIGNAGSGKTTAANHLVSNGYCRLRFAEALKLMLRFGLGVPHEYVDGNKKNEACEELCGVTARQAMITLGTEWGRNMIHKDLWVKALERKLIRAIGEGENKFVIDDLRFLSEAKWLKEFKISIETCMIRIVRGEGVVLNHQSETEQSQIEEDWVILNNGTIENMCKSIDQIVKMCFKEK